MPATKLTQSFGINVENSDHDIRHVTHPATLVGSYSALLSAVACSFFKPLDLPSRDQAVSLAIVNTVMEGLSVSPIAKDMLKSWAEGKLTDEDLLPFADGNSPADTPTHGRCSRRRAFRGARAIAELANNKGARSIAAEAAVAFDFTKLWYPTLWNTRGIRDVADSRKPALPSVQSVSPPANRLD